MANLIISPYAVSFESIKNNLQQYVSEKSLTNDVWKDFYASATGETIIEIAAALGTFYAYQFLTGRRECFLSTAQNYTSLLGLAENLGYCVSRGNNLKLSINIVPNQTVINLPKWTVIGTYGEYDIVLYEDVTLNEDVETTIKVIIGNSMVESRSITTQDLTQFTFSNPNVTNDIRIIINDKEVPVSGDIKDAINDKYIAISNVYGSVDVMYLNDGEYPYKNGDTMYLNFIERNNLKYVDFTPSILSIDYAHQVNEVTLLQDGQDKENAEKIRTTAPILHQTNNMVRSRKDYSRYLLVNGVDIIDANDRDIYPGLIEISYLKSDHSLMNDSEKQQWLTEIDSIRPGGVADAIITNPEQVTKNIEITLYKKKSVDVSSAAIGEEIKNIVEAYNNKLGITLDLNQIEHDIEEDPNIKIARVDIPKSTWQANTSMQLYDVINTSEGDFYVNDFKFFTGAEEPIWSRLNIGDKFVDNQIIWRRTNDYPQEIVNSWSANTSFNKHDCIKKEYITYDNLDSLSGDVEPVWGGDTVIDYHVIWERQETVSTASQWQANHSYNIGDLITVDNNQITYKMVRIVQNTQILTYTMVVDSFVSGTGSVEPDWSTQIQQDNTVTWERITEPTDASWQANRYTVLGDLIKVVNSGTTYYYKCSSAGTTGSAQPTWGADTVTDNTVEWTKFNEAWSPNTPYAINNIVMVLISTGVYYYKVITAGISGALQPDWLSKIVADGNVTWQATNKVTDNTWSASTNKSIGDLIKIISGQLPHYYEVVSIRGTTGGSEPDWTDLDNNKVIDNSIEWVKILEESNTIELGWNKYLNATFTYSIV